MIIDLLKSAHHPSELMAMLKIKFGGYAPKDNSEPLEYLAQKLDSKAFCYAALNQVSRSFAVVIQQLPDQLKDPVCVFYLVLRGLDSVEDDMTFEKDQRIALVREFHAKCQQPGWNIQGVGDSQDYRVLLSNFHHVIHLFHSLQPEYQDVIVDICKKMGDGMADYAEKKVNSLSDYDHYCHYVAGLVGIGLSKLFSASGLETPYLQEEYDLANSMGLLLQKTNISRDYYEDLHQGRVFWPRQIWGKYAERLEQFHDQPHSAESLACINEMVTNALVHVSNCILYLNMIRDPKVFRFCAIPQVMAMATLAKIYNNPNVYTEVVKIRKGIAAKMMLDTTDMDKVKKYMEQFVQTIREKLNTADPNYTLTKKRLNRIIEALDDVKYAQRAQPVLETTVFF